MLDDRPSSNPVPARPTDAATSGTVAHCKPCWLLALLLPILLLPAPAAAQNFVVIGGGAEYEGGNSVAVADGSVYVAGQFFSATDFDPGAGTTELTPPSSGRATFLASYDASGALNWAFQIDDDANFHEGLALDAEGNLYVTGTFSGTVDFDPDPTGTAEHTASLRKAYVASYTSGGAFRFVNTFGSDTPDGPITAGHVVVDDADDLYVVGTFRSTVDFDPSGGTAERTSAGFHEDAYVVSYTSGGAFRSVVTFGSTATSIFSGELPSPRYVAVDDAGNVYMTGTFLGTVDFDPGAGTADRTSAGSHDGFLVSFDASGAFRDVVTIGSSATDNFSGLALDAAGTVYTNGRFSGTVDFDPVGTAEETPGSAGYDMFLASYTFGAGGASLNFVRRTSLASGTHATFQTLAIDGDGNLYTADCYGGTVDFDLGGGTAELTATGSDDSDAFVASYTSSGDYRFAYGLEGDIYSCAYGVTVSADGQLVLTGDFDGTTDFDPSSGIETRTAVAGGSLDFFVLSFDTDVVPSVTPPDFVFADGVGGDDYEAFYAVAVDDVGNSYVTGDFGGTVDFDPGAGEAHLTATDDYSGVVASYDATGTYRWAFAIGGTSSVGVGVAVGPSGDVYVTGNFGGTVDFDPGDGTASRTSTSIEDVFVARYGADGSFQWVVTFGSLFSNEGKGVTVTASGDVYVMGSFYGTVDFDPGDGVAERTSNGEDFFSDAFLARYDADGNFVSVLAIGGTSNDRGQGVAVDAAGNVYVTGRFSDTVDFDPGSGTADRTSNGGNDFFLASYDAAGDLRYVVTAGGSSTDAANAVRVDASGNAYVAGSFQSTVDFDPGTGVAEQTASGNALSGFLASYDASGAYRFAFPIDGAGQDDAQGLALDATGNVYVTGTVEQTVDFDPSLGVAALTAAGGSDAYVASYTSEGAYRYAFLLGGSSDEYAFGMAVTADGEPLVAGVFYSADGDFDPGPGTAPLTPDAFGNGDAFLVSFAPGTPAASVTVSAALWLEGPFDTGTGTMTVALSDHLPQTDPYSLSQSVNTADFFTTDTNGQQVVDWIYLQLRSDETTTVATTAALLMSDGSITTTDATSAASLDVVPGSYWLVVGHRNHLAVMSSAPLDCSSGSCSYDFRSSQGLAYGDDAMAEMTLGAVGLYAGDADGSGDIFNTDLVSYWLVQTGTAGYLSADFDLSGDVFNTDLVSYWLSNTGRSTNVP